MKKDKRIDEYILKAQPFAQPILKHLRELIHKACPQTEETMKWSFPHFDYNGKILCAVAGFKQHCSFNLWLGSYLNLSNKSTKDSEGMGIFGKITSLQNLPSDEEIIDMIHQAMNLSDEGKTIHRKVSTKKADISFPEGFDKALKKNKNALLHFEKFSPSKKKEYIEWISEAKTEATRSRRLETSIEWIAEGKSRNWKYEKK